MYFTRWVSIPLGFPQSNMQFKRVSIRQSPLRKTSGGIVNNSIILDFHTTGTEKFALLTRPIINGLSGYLSNYLIPGIIRQQVKQKQLIPSSIVSEITEM